MTRPGRSPESASGSDRQTVRAALVLELPVSRHTTHTSYYHPFTQHEILALLGLTCDCEGIGLRLPSRTPSDAFNLHGKVIAVVRREDDSLPAEPST